MGRVKTHTPNNITSISFHMQTWNLLLSEYFYTSMQLLCMIVYSISVRFIHAKNRVTKGSPIDLPLQVFPSLLSEYPLSQLQTEPLAVNVQVCSQPPLLARHSLIGVCSMKGQYIV